MERGIGDRRDQFKSKGLTEPERRRIALAKQQAEKRGELVQRFRDLHWQCLEGGGRAEQEPVELEPEMDVEEQESDGEAAPEQPQPKSKRRCARSRFFANQLMHPDWMIDIPEDLASWTVFCRPEGPTVLLIAEDRGRSVVARAKNGKFLHKVRDAPPTLPDGLTVLEAVWCAEAQTHVLVDVLIWGESDLTSADAECRQFWLAARGEELDIPELGPLAQMQAAAPSKENKQPSVPWRVARAVPAPALPEAIRHLYADDLGYTKDSLVFHHRAGNYTRGLTPLCLAWRDCRLSRWTVDTPDPSGPLGDFVVVLRLKDNGQLKTWDRHVVAQLEPELAKQLGENLVRCEVLAVADPPNRALHLGRVWDCSKARLTPDSWARIFTQYAHRRVWNPAAPAAHPIIPAQTLCGL